MFEVDYNYLITFDPNKSYKTHTCWNYLERWVTSAKQAFQVSFPVIYHEIGSRKSLLQAEQEQAATFWTDSKRVRRISALIIVRTITGERWGNGQSVAAAAAAAFSIRWIESLQPVPDKDCDVICSPQITRAGHSMNFSYRVADIKFRVGAIKYRGLKTWAYRPRDHRVSVHAHRILSLYNAVFTGLIVRYLVC